MSAANGPRGDRAWSWPIGRRRGASAAALLLTASLAVAISAPVAVAGAAPSKRHSDSAGTAAGGPVRSCESLASLAIADATDDVVFTIDSAVVDAGDETLPPSCRVEVSATHPPAGDDVNIWIWLPTTNWNGRFQGTGGGGFSGGSQNSLQGPLRAGYATGATDTGHVGGSGSFALDENGRLNWQLIRDNAYLGIHEMTVAGKTLTEAFYGTAPRYSYFNGCSTGGRQGLSEAQRYPGDYDGMLSGAPAINWPKLHVAQLWGQLKMLEADNFVAQCKFQAATDAAVAACDGIDGVADGVIEDPNRCTFDPATLVGTETACGPITAADADIIQAIWEGPRTSDGDFLWYGLEPGASFGGLNNTTGTPPQGSPFGITLQWFRYFLTMDPEWDWTTIDQDAYELFWLQSVEQYGEVLGTDNPDLSDFAARGGKIVLWHGWNDQLIYPMGTVDYYDRVVDIMGGRSRSDKFIRLFMAPGVAHCGGGTGPSPTGQFEALVRWVEEGKPPDTLTAQRQVGDVTRTRPLCMYPLVARYKGHGSTDDAASFHCKKEF